MARRSQRKHSTAKHPDQTDLLIGKRVRLRRVHLDITQQRLARVLGISFQQLQKYENGMNRISAGRLVAIADELEVEPSYFFGKQPAGKAGYDQDLVTEMLSTAGGFDLANAFLAMEVGPRRSLLTLARAIAVAARPRRHRRNCGHARAVNLSWRASP